MNGLTCAAACVTATVAVLGELRQRKLHHAHCELHVWKMAKVVFLELNSHGPVGATIRHILVDNRPLHDGDRLIDIDRILDRVDTFEMPWWITVEQFQDWSRTSNCGMKDETFTFVKCSVDDIYYAEMTEQDRKLLQNVLSIVTNMLENLQMKVLYNTMGFENSRLKCVTL